METLDSAHDSYQPTKLSVEDLNGPAKKKVESVLGTTFSGFTVKKEHIYGYGHEDGVEDAEGRKWWLTIRDPSDGYHHSHQHW